ERLALVDRVRKSRERPERHAGRGCAECHRALGNRVVEIPTEAVTGRAGGHSGFHAEDRSTVSRPIRSDLVNVESRGPAAPNSPRLDRYTHDLDIDGGDIALAKLERE